MIRKIAWLAGLGAALALCGPARAAIDAYSFELGYSEDVRLWRLGAQWKWSRTWAVSRAWEIGGYWDFSAGGWRNGEHTFYDFGVTPVFRLRRREPSWPSLYLEAAIGFRVLSDLRIGRDLHFGTNFQFGDHLGAGVRFGRGGRYDLSLRLQHVSNGGIRDPNPGIDFVQLRMQYHLQ